MCALRINCSPMPSVDAMLASSPLAGLRRVSQGGGDQMVTRVRLAEQLADLDDAPAASFVVLSRAASAEAADYRFDMALRWAAIHQVAAVAAFSADLWQPTLTSMDIAERANIAMVSVPAAMELTWLLPAIVRETGGGADRALGRAEQGLEAVLRAEESGADLDGLRACVSSALGTTVDFRASALANGGPPAADEASAPVMVGNMTLGHFAAPDAHGDLAVAARLVLHAAASAAGRLLDMAGRAREVPARSRSELLAELLMSDSLSEDLLDRARQLGVPVGGWHVAVQAVTRAGGTWYVSRVARTIVLLRMTSSRPGPQAGLQTARSAGRALDAIRDRLPGLRVRGGVGTPHEGPLGLLAARAAGKPDGVAAHDAVVVQRMLMEWYASDTARASV